MRIWTFVFSCFPIYKNKNSDEIRKFHAMDEADCDILGEVLKSLEDEHSKTPSIKSVDVPFIDQETNLASDSTAKSRKINSSQLSEKSVVHTGDTDSSDDEENRYFEETRYNAYGKSIKENLKKTQNPSHRGPSATPFQAKVTKPANSSPSTDDTKEPALGKMDVYMEPIFGLRIVNPLYSSQVVKSKMSGRTPVSFFKLKNFVQHGDLSSDWVVGGVIVEKSAPKVSQKGTKYLIWKLSDLKMGLKTASVFLFGKSYQDLWKIQPGTALGILNPSVMKSSDNSKDEATLSITTADQVMIWGRSKDLGQCKGKKKSGDQCTAFVNATDCSYCVYHVQTEYKKFTGRSELQSPTGGNLRTLQNKVLGKNEVFYEGRSFSAAPARGCRKSAAKDVKRLSSLGESQRVPLFPTAPTPPPPMNRRTTQILNNTNNKDDQRLKTLENENKVAKFRPKLSNPEMDDSEYQVKKPNAEFLAKVKKLMVPTAKNNSEARKSTKESDSKKPSNNSETKRPANSVSSEEATAKALENRSPTTINPLPVKGKGAIQLMVKTITTSTSPRQSRAKLKALEFVKKRGPILKESPKNSRKNNVAQALKRQIDESSSEKPETDPGKPQLSQRFIELMNMESSKQYLIDAHEKAQEDQYFARLEKKEQMEEKMLNTFKIECKAYKCFQCKYVWFSASDMCKAERHTIKVVDAMKRFFKCNKCSNRAVSLDKMPHIPCKKCGASSWSKTAMMKERVVGVTNHLSIRGGEQKFINSVATNASLDLLMPE